MPYSPRSSARNRNAVEVQCELLTGTAGGRVHAFIAPAEVICGLSGLATRTRFTPYRCREHAFGELALIATRLVRAAWEDRVRSRNIASQNEHRRIGH